jgi:uncharacterized OB-fold protein
MAKKVWYVENNWTCSSCGTVNKGRDIRCTQCGNPKEKNEKDRIDPKAVVTEPELLKLAKQGAHWECEYCGSKVRAPDGNCASCAGPKGAQETQKTSGRRVETIDVSEMKPRQVAETINQARARAGIPSLEEATTDSSPDPSWGMIALIATGLIASISFGVWLLTPYEENFRVVQTNWTHSSYVDLRLTRSGSGWGSPFGAFDVSCVTRQHGTHDCNAYRCNEHEESYRCDPYDCNCRDVCRDLNNGFSECSEVCSTCYDTCYRTVYDTCYEQCPTYDEWCTYKYYEWDQVAQQQRQGSCSEPSTWADMGPMDEVHRERRISAYVVIFENESSKERMIASSWEECSKYKVGALWKVKVSRAGLFEPLNARD